MTHIRLKGSDQAKAEPNTIRLKLLKFETKVIRSVRRIKLSFPDAYPYQNIFFTAWKQLAPG